MRDAITLQRIQKLHPAVRQEATEIYEKICAALTGKAYCRFTHTLRTIKEQDALYAQGRTAPGKKVTWARGGESFHNYGLAIDICLIVNKKEASWDTKTDFDSDTIADWMEVVRIFKIYGWEWGGDWKNKPDRPHFQKTFGMRTKELRSALKPGMIYPDLK
jgi:peptidoglycan L-alanyl-D-glutamate endopeptidase CwlK